MMINPNTSKYPINDAGGQVFISPKVLFDKGTPDKLELPKVRGTLLYDPQKVDINVARQMKEQGAIPLNSRFYRKMKGALKHMKNPKLVDVEAGNNIVGQLKYVSPEKYKWFDTNILPQVQEYYKGI